jgi:hypothetical protein
MCMHLFLEQCWDLPAPPWLFLKPIGTIRGLTHGGVQCQSSAPTFTYYTHAPTAPSLPAGASVLLLAGSALVTGTSLELRGGDGGRPAPASPPPAAVLPPTSAVSPIVVKSRLLFLQQASRKPYSALFLSSMADASDGLLLVFCCWLVKNLKSLS